MTEQQTSVSRGDRLVYGFPGVFWIANWMEVVERFAYYGLRTVLPLFMVLAYEDGGPQFSHVQKGHIFLWWAMVQSFLPVFTGGFADRYGYKINIGISTVVKMAGYLVMGYAIEIAAGMNGLSMDEHLGAAGGTYTYPIFFTGAMLLAAGTAIFKPGVQGLIATKIPAGKSSFGWGIFYQMVNIGGFIGPLLAGYLRIVSWKFVFIACTIGIALNFLPLLFFAEPKRVANQGYEGQNAKQVFMDSLREFIKPRVLFFTISFAGFWLMFYQLFDILPNFIDDWVDSSGAAQFIEGNLAGLPLMPALLVVLAALTIIRLKFVGWKFADLGSIEKMFWPGTIVVCALAMAVGFNPVLSDDFVPKVNGGNLTQEWMINFNALLISLFAFAMGFITGKFKAMPAMIVGILICALAIYGLGVSYNGWWTLFAIGVFSLGEMTASPTKLRYLSGIAPPGKKGLYLGYANATVGIGWSIGSVVAGNWYEEGGDKVNLALQDYVQGKQIPAIVNNLTEEELIRSFSTMTGLSTLETMNLLFQPDSIEVETDPAKLLTWFQGDDSKFADSLPGDLSGKALPELITALAASTGLPAEYITRFPSAMSDAATKPILEFVRTTLAEYERTAGKIKLIQDSGLFNRLSGELGIAYYSAQRICFDDDVRANGLDLDALAAKVQPIWEASKESGKVKAHELEDQTALARVLAGVGSDFADPGDGDQAQAVLDLRSKPLPADLETLRAEFGATRLAVSANSAPLQATLVTLAEAIEGNEEEKMDKAKSFFQKSRVMRMAAASKGQEIGVYRIYLWETYKPYLMWAKFALIGIGSMILMILYHFGVKRANAKLAKESA
ncbi:MAG: MFS transporter [Planctomycetes bacterium]|nr:MFS transporter [Planctomycetota bacterium]